MESTYILFEADSSAFSNVSIELEKLLATATAEFIIVTGALERMLPVTLRSGVSSIVSVPVFSCSSTRDRELNPDPERSRLGVAVVLIELDKAKLPVIVKVCPATLFQFAVLLDINDRLDIVEVAKVIGDAAVLVTYTFGLAIVPKEPVIDPPPAPPKNIVEGLN